MTDKEAFLNPRGRYRGEVKPENLVFNANLQEFAVRVSYLCNLQTNGKLSPEEAYEQIKALWQQLDDSKQQLGVGDSPFQAQDNSDP
jgi:hypothetical protein